MSTGPAIRLYFNLIPESLVASNLEPEAYGTYLAVGQTGRSRGQAMFFDVDPGLLPASFPLAEARRRCHPTADGQPKHSVYLGIYRVLERIPTPALGKLYLATDDGRVLALEAGSCPVEEPGLHYYQEFVPVKPRVLSTLGPAAFARYLTAPGHPVSLPRVVFAGLLLPDPAAEDPGNLPYAEMDHLRATMASMQGPAGKPVKMITRAFRGEVIYRTIRGGFYVGDPEGLKCYPMPSREVLECQHHAWWRSAETIHSV